MYIKSGDRQIYYESRGEGPAIVFCHGFGGSHVVWCEQVKKFSRDYQTVTFDQAGHGASKGNFASKIMDLINDTAKLIKGLKLNNIILVGHSMGASVVWGLLKYHPEIKVRKFVTVDQSPFMLNGADWPYGYLNLTQENFRRELTSGKHVKETLNGLADSVYAQLAPFKKLHPFDQKSNLPLMFDHVQHDWRPVCAHAATPGLMISSKQSPYFRFGYANIFSQINPNIQEIDVSDTGHDIMAENPTEFNQILANYLKE